ncbi:MAG TPA: hypothetical protein PLY93_09480, partial [Turneriella sp.]|nr:hypothetical protein [Turneriella sp.]
MPLFESAFIAGLKSVLTSALYPVLPFLLVLFWHGDKKTRKTRFVHAVIFAFVFTLLFTIMNALGGSGIVRLTANSYFIYAIVFFLLYFALAFARLLPAKITPRFLTQPPTLVSLFALSSFAALFAIAFMGNSVSSLLVQVAKAMQVQTNVLLPLFAVFLFAFAVEFPLLLVSFLLITLPSKPEWQKYMRYAISTLFIAAAFHYAEDSVGNFPDAAQAFPFAAIGFGMCVTFYLLADPALSDASMPRRLKINTSGMLLLSGLGLFLFTSLFVKYWVSKLKPMRSFKKAR